MIGQCYIDGVDIYVKYGVIISGDGYDQLLSFPDIIEPDRNDWPEEHGIDVDLTDPHVQAHEVNIDFAFIRGFSWRSFYAFLSGPYLRTVNIPSLARTWSLRAVEMPKLDTYLGGDLFTVKFSEDETGIPIGYPEANANVGLTSILSIDGKTLDKYGIIITSGLDDLDKAPKMKRALARSNALLNGQIYDNELVKYAEKDVTFGCCLNASQMENFWNLRDALFGDLLKPGLRTVGYNRKNYEAYYRKTGNWKLHSHVGEVVCEFDLTLCFTAFVIQNEIYLLASENGTFIATEDGKIIDLTY